MGYRSSVYFQIPTDKWDEFREALESERLLHANPPEMKDIDQFLTDLRQEQFPDRYIYFHDYIKWYSEEDTVINTVENAVKSLDDYTFYRVGEDADDVDFWDSSDDSEWVRVNSVSCKGTMDVLNMGLIFFENIAKAPPAVRKKAIAKLNEVLGLLIEAEGGAPIDLDTPDFSEEE